MIKLNVKDAILRLLAVEQNVDLKNFATTGYLNYPSEQICKLEHILYKHNYKVIKELCKQNHPRFTKLL